MLFQRLFEIGQGAASIDTELDVWRDSRQEKWLNFSGVGLVKHTRDLCIARTWCGEFSRRSRSPLNWQSWLAKHVTAIDGDMVSGLLVLVKNKSMLRLCVVNNDQ